VDYGYAVKSVVVDGEDDVYPVTVTAEKDGRDVVFKAKYVLVSLFMHRLDGGLRNQGCDGAHSSVRHSLGYKMIGDSTDAVWGVMDIYPRTDFPDIRKKATIHSAAGNLLASTPHPSE
jgi:phenol 2-monooxygenase